MLAALRAIAGDACHVSTSGLGACYRGGRSEESIYMSDRVCDSCRAAKAIGVIPAPLPDPPESGLVSKNGMVFREVQTGVWRLIEGVGEGAKFSRDWRWLVESPGVLVPLTLGDPIGGKP
jgi:hypothetical protein